MHNATSRKCADSSVVEHTIADCEVDGSIPPRRFVFFSHLFGVMLQRGLLPLWNRRIPIVVSSIRFFGRRRSVDNEIDEYDFNTAANATTDIGSTPEGSYSKSDELRTQSDNIQNKMVSTPVSPQKESVDWNSLKNAGFNDLKTVPAHSKRKELMSHVPSETVVMKYGYVLFNIFL